MNKTIKALAILLVALCLVDSASAQKKGVKGSGTIEKKEYSILEYSQIDLKAGATLYYEEKLDEAAYVRLELDENLLPYMKVFVKDKKLTIEEANVLNPSSFKIYTNSRNITDLNLLANGNIYVEGKTHVKDLKIQLKGTGNFEVANLLAKSVSVVISGAGSAKLKGTTESVDLLIDKKGSGSVNTEALVADDVSCDISGTGSMAVLVNKKLEAKIGGSGSITYTGEPRDLCYSLRGTGKVEKALAKEQEKE